MSKLTLNGKNIRDPSKLTITKNPVWSANAGRASNGDMVGDIICWKYKLQIEWPALSQADAAEIDAAVTDTVFFPVVFVDPASKSGATKTITGYVGTPTYPVYSYVEGYPRYTGVAMDIVEK